MATIIAKNDPFKILQDFVDNKNIDIKDILENTDLFKLSLHYEKYKKSVNLPAAKMIVNNQILVYRIGALLKYQTTDLRRLSKEEKQLLEIPFEVEEGSTEITADSLEQIKRIIEMIPEQQRICVIVTFLLCFFGWLVFKRYMEYREKKLDNEKTKDNYNLINNAIDKLSLANSKLAEIVKEYEKENLNNLEEIDTSITYQGEKYTSEEIREIKKIRFPRKPSEEPEAKQLRGNYRVVSINLEQKYINIKKDDDIERVYYAEDLLNVIENFKAQFKEAIDNEGKIFYIEAGYSIKNGKKSPLILNVMRPA